MPRSRNSSCTISAMSRSSWGRIWARGENSVQRTPQLWKNSAYSQPVAPAPTTSRCSGNSCRSSTARVVNTHSWSTFANGGSHGEAPVAIRRWSYSSARIPSSVCDLEHAVLGDVTLAVDDLGLGRVEALAYGSRLVRGKPAGVGDRAQQVDVGTPVLEADADALGVLDGRHHRRRVQQRLRRDRVGERAVAPETASLDHGHARADRRRSTRSGIPGRAAAEDHEAHG